MELLKTDGVSKVFGGLKAVSNFDIEINEGELIGLIGPNGAGKTTAFNLLTGVYQPTTGTIDFAGKSLVGLKPYQITSRGIARTFQNIRLFKDLTVYENVLIANHLHLKSDFLSATLHLPWYIKEAKQMKTINSLVADGLILIVQAAQKNYQAGKKSLAALDLKGFKLALELAKGKNLVQSRTYTILLNDLTQLQKSL